MKPNKMWELPSVLKYSDFLQMNIQRMSNLSSAIKRIAFSVELILVGTALNEKSNLLAWFGFLAAVGFWMLDSYYLALEKSLRAKWDTWVTKINSGEFDSAIFMNLSTKASPDYFYAFQSPLNVNTYLGMLLLPIVSLILI